MFENLYSLVSYISVGVVQLIAGAMIILAIFGGKITIEANGICGLFKKKEDKDNV